MSGINPSRFSAIKAVSRLSPTLPGEVTPAPAYSSPEEYEMGNMAGPSQLHQPSPIQRQRHSSQMLGPELASAFDLPHPNDFENSPRAEQQAKGPDNHGKELPINFYKPRKELSKRHWWLLIAVLVVLIIAIPLIVFFIVKNAHKNNNLTTPLPQNFTTTSFVTKSTETTKIQPTTLKTTFSTTMVENATLISLTTATQTTVSITTITEIQSYPTFLVVTQSIPYFITEISTLSLTTILTSIQTSSLPISIPPITELSTITSIISFPFLITQVESTTITSLLTGSIITHTVTALGSALASTITQTTTSTTTESALMQPTMAASCYGLMNSICANNTAIPSDWSGPFQGCQYILQYFYCNLLEQIEQSDELIIPGGLPGLVCKNLKGFCQEIAGGSASTSSK